MMRRLLRGEYIPFGSQYYRAPSPPASDWEADLASLAALGFNTVKFWTQWRWNNPQEGVYDFADIDELMRLAAKNGLRVMLNTIVDVAPAWIYAKYPDASMRTLDGRNVGPQVQPHRQIGGLGLCLNHAPAMEHMHAFIGAAVRRYREHPALAMWNVASEPELTQSMAELRLYALDAAHMGDMLCYCVRCREAFRAWLEAKYRAIGTLNAVWNRNYASFAEAEIPLTRNSFGDVIDWRMFFADVLARNVRRRFEIARAEDRGAHPLLSHHVFIQGFPFTSTGSDPWNFAREGDLHGITQMDDPMMCDLLRSAARGKPVISAEMLMLFGYTLDVPKPVAANDVKRYVFTGIAANLKGFLFWQYRPELLAREAPAWGLTFLDGSPTPWLGAYAETNGVVQKNASFLLDAAPRPAEVALLYNPENQVFGWAATGNEMNVTDSLRGIHRALYEANFVTDFIHVREATAELLAGYRVIIVPFPYMLDAPACAALAAWVEAGGVLIGEAYFAGWHREEGRHQTRVPGYGLDRLFRAHQGVVAPPGADGAVEIITGAGIPGLRSGSRVRGAIVAESLVTDGARIVARFASGDPAVTVGSCGRGHGILIGSMVGIPLQRGSARANAALITGLVDLKCRIPRPAVSNRARVRVDLLATPKGERMLILRNLDERPRACTITIPGTGGGRFIEQFDGTGLTLKSRGPGAEARVRLAPSEVRVYRG